MLKEIKNVHWTVQSHRTQVLLFLLADIFVELLFVLQVAMTVFTTSFMFVHLVTLQLHLFKLEFWIDFFSPSGTNWSLPVGAS